MLKNIYQKHKKIVDKCRILKKNVYRETKWQKGVVEMLFYHIPR